MIYGGTWTDEENRLFLQAFKKHGEDWDSIADLIKTR